MPRKAIALLPISLAIALAIALGPAAVHAQPAEDPDGAPPAGPPDDNSFSPQTKVDTAGARRSAAIDAAFGRAPSGATDDPSTTNDPGYSSRRGNGTGDATYGSTARSIGTTGEFIDGYDIYDEVYDDDRGYAEDVPDVHVVQRGDTLSGISSYYLRDVHAWPRLWSWNEHVTNAHWIFPGDRIRLYDPRFGPRGDDVPAFRYSKTRVPDGSRFETLNLNQFAFVDANDFDTSMKVVGGGEANVMMSTLDTVYMSYDRSRPPIAGERLVVYAPQEKVYDLKDKKLLGYVVQIMGEVQIESIARKTVEGTVATAHNPIERNYRVGPLRRQFRRIDAVPATESATGVVVATLNDTSPFPKQSRRRKSLLGEHVMVGETQFMVVNIGTASGLEVGNVLEVVRKGDEYTDKRVFHIPYDDGWPRRVIGEAVVVQVQASTALLASTYSRREIERGDHVELRSPEAIAAQREEEEAMLRGDTPSRSGRGKGGAKGNVEVGDGKARGGVSIGGGGKGGGSSGSGTGGGGATTGDGAVDPTDPIYFPSHD
jgi:LysM repeat protein